MTEEILSSSIRHHPNALKARRKTKAAPPPFPPPLRGPRRAKLALEVREGGPRVALDQESTNPTSTKYTARNPCPIAPTGPRRANPRPTTASRRAAAASSGRPPHAKPPSAAPPAAGRDIGVGGRSEHNNRKLFPTIIYLLSCSGEALSGNAK
jgi:hypothetical protein